mmetsp:Transcript_13334/g.26358  ORF Transcript_13334/g.26358 Transcript_13334/m.26358 type:complete len:83 (+) Transcript_13334:1391-1639(+)
MLSAVNMNGGMKKKTESGPAAFVSFALKQLRCGLKDWWVDGCPAGVFSKLRVPPSICAKIALTAVSCLSLVPSADVKERSVR